MRSIVVILHNLRSVHNVGSIYRTADGCGVEHIYCTGYTPYPELPDDTRLPHERRKLMNQLHKTALGAEETIPSTHSETVEDIITSLRADGFQIAALEQASDSTPLTKFSPHQKIALVCGREVEGLEENIRKNCDITVEIPMIGSKESYNVSIAAAIALYHCRFIT